VVNLAEDPQIAVKADVAFADSAFARAMESVDLFVTRTEEIFLGVTATTCVSAIVSNVHV